MSKRVDFINNSTTVEDDFLDDIQELLSRWIGGIRLERTGSAVVRATIDQVGALVTDSGKHRFVTSSPQLTVTGSAGARNLYAIGGADSGGDPAINTNKAWTLEAAAGAASGSNPRKIGTLDYDGVSTISNIRYTAGQQPPADLFNAYIITPNDPYGIPLSIRALAGQASAALFQIGSDAAVNDRLVVTPAGMLQLPVQGSGGGVRFGGEAASNLYRSAVNTIKTDGNFVIAGNLTVNGNVQIDGDLTVTGNTTFSASAGTSIEVPVGSVGVPSVFFSGDTDTGFYSPGADQFAITVGGNQRLVVGTGGVTLNGGGITAQGNSRIGSNDAHTLGFFSVSGVARIMGWTPTNSSTDRAFNADSVTLHELADVVATLVNDLKSYGLLGG